MHVSQSGHNSSYVELWPLWMTAAKTRDIRQGSQMSSHALHTRRPFTRADALAAGVSAKMLRGSRFRRLFRGIYIDSAVTVDDVVRTAAALALHPPDAFASHLSAARVLRIPVPESPDEHVSVWHEADRRPRRNIRSHTAPSSIRVIHHRGVRVSCAADTFIALASLLPLVDLVIAGDAMVRLNLVTAEQLRRATEESHDRYAVPARRAAGFVRDGVDSPMETRLRMLIVLAGLPEPQVNHIVRKANGDWIVRFDLSYPRLRLVIEYDGRQHAEDTAQWQHDIERREYLDRGDWRLIVITAKGIFVEPERTLARIRDALRDRGCENLPRHLSDEWRRHFASRR